MKKLLTIALLVALVFGVSCGKADDAADNGETINGEETTERISEEPGDESEKEQSELICLAENLNVHAEPGTASKVVGAISRGELVTKITRGRGEYLPDDPSGYIDWWNVELPNGTEGWVARMFVIDYEAFKQLEEVDLAAKSGDSAKTEAAIKAYIDEADGTDDNTSRGYSRSPDGSMFAISDGFGGIGGFKITVGYGVSSRAPLGGYETLGRWIYGSRYWSVNTHRRLNVYESNSMKAVFRPSCWRGVHKYVEEREILVWLGYIEIEEIEYPLINGPVTEPDYSANIPNPNYLECDGILCLMVYEFATGKSYMAAAPDLTTLSKDHVILKPTERFASNPLFKPVSETEVYKEWVGMPVYASSSQE